MNYNVDFKNIDGLWYLYIFNTDDNVIIYDGLIPGSKNYTHVDCAVFAEDIIDKSRKRYRVKKSKFRELGFNACGISFAFQLSSAGAFGAYSADRRAYIKRLASAEILRYFDGNDKERTTIKIIVLCFKFTASY